MERIAQCVLVGLVMLPGAVRAQENDDRDTQVMERFLALLEKNPRRGTALDRVYGYHVERGTLDAFLKTYEDRTQADPKDGVAWMVRGLIESQRGRDAAAVTALRKAEETRVEDPLPSYYLGQALVLVGRPDAAVEAFERAIQRGPARGDLLEIYQALGRVHQRAQHPEKALAVWGRLEKAFPEDLRVQEQIAAALAEESQPEQALVHYEQLAKQARDPYQQVLMKIEAAELKVRLGRSAEALKDFEGLLGRLEPGSWLSKEVRRKLEEVFTRNDDLAGLAKYYEGWVAKNAEDVEAMTRLGRTLANLGRVKDARTWFDKALKLAPSRRELRQALIEQLVHEGKFADAAAQYEAMAKADPNNPDTLREWGRLLLRDTNRPDAERKQAAAAVWKRLLDARPDDATTATQVADLFRQANMAEDAIALYKKAIALAPASSQYYEYLGEYYHVLKRDEEAKATWARIAAGSNRNAKNLGRLAEVLAGFGFKSDALAAIAEACRLQADEFDLRMKHADLLQQLERFDEALAQLEIAAKVADDEEQREAVLEAEIKAYGAAGKLGARIDALRTALVKTGATNGSTPNSPDQGGEPALWRRLARYLEADQKAAEATAAINQATAIDPKSVPGWVASARLHEGAGDLAGAAASLRKLAELDRRNRAEYLTSVAKLEARMGHRDAALNAGRDVLAAAPGNPEHYQFFAELCFGLGENEQGLDALRRSVRLNPADPKILQALGEALSAQFRTEEAIELYWRAFDKAPDLDARLGVVARLTELYLQRNQFDRLIARLEREQREGDKQRELAICLAAAYQASGDFGTARQALEKLVAANARDTVLLFQLSGLAEREGDVAAAAKYQQQINDVAPSDEGAVRLAQLLVRSGEVGEAELVWAKLAASDPSPLRTLQALDSLLANDKAEAALRIAEQALRKRPGDWELLYREGVALEDLGRREEAAGRFRALLDLSTDDDTESEHVKARRRAALKPAPGMPPNSAAARTQFNVPMQTRVADVWQVRNAVGIEGRQVSMGLYNQQPIWTPSDFGQARMAAAGWLLALSQRESKHEELVQAFRAKAARVSATNLRSLYDFYYLQTVRNDGREAYEAARAIAKAAPNDPKAQWTWLNTLVSRASTQGLMGYSLPGTSTGSDRTPALADAELDAVLAAFRTIKIQTPEWLGWQVLSSVGTELRRAGRKELEDQFAREAVAAANSTDAVGSVMIFAAPRGDVDGLLALYDKFTRLRKGRSSIAYGSGWSGANSLGQAMAARAEAKAHADVLKILDYYLAKARKEKAAPGAAGRSAAMYTNATGMAPGQVRIALGRTIRGIGLDIPAPNPYFDQGAIQLLRNAFEIYKRDDLLTDLFAHLRKQAEGEASPAAERVQPMLAMAYLMWWNEEQDEAIVWHQRACEAAKNDAELVLEQADMHEKRGETGEALALADTVEPLDQVTMQRRENMALRLSVVTGNVERARQAAERLFGLRLEGDAQILLASQMHQLGMHDLGEAVLARARRRTGNRSGSLLALMHQYQSQNKTELAVQIAHQILRKPPAAPLMNNQGGYVGNPNEDNQARMQAIQVLALSGKLRELIARGEAQLEASPRSVALHQMMIDYYRADGNKAKIRAMYDRLAKIRPGDVRLQYQIAQELIGTGETEAGLALYRETLKKEPGLFGNNYWQVQQTFQQANKLDDLASLYEEIDLTALGQPWGVTQLAQMLVPDPKRRERGLALFRRAWKAFPTQRQNILGNMYTDDIKRLPEIYDYGLQAVLPAPGAAKLKPWANVEDRIWSNAQDGRLTTVTTRMLEIAAVQNKLDVLDRDVSKAIEEQPEWLGGKAIRVVIQARRGKIAAAKRDLKVLLDDEKEPMPSDVKWTVAQLVEDVGSMQDVVVPLYESALKRGPSRQYSYDDGFTDTPARRLVVLYKRSGRTEEAYELVMRAARDDSTSADNDPDWSAGVKVQKAAAISQQLLELGYPADAVRLSNTLLGEPATLENAQQHGGNFSGQLEQTLNHGLNGLNRENLPRTLRSLVRPATAPNAAEKGLDLVLMIQARHVLSKATVASLVGSALKSAAEMPELLAEAKRDLAARREAEPKDLGTHVASALAAFVDGNPEGIDAAVGKLVALMNETPLEPLPEGLRANARQRAEATPQLSLWLVARECWNHDSVRSAGDLLGDRALDAARRQTDHRWSFAMLRERGAAMLARGDRTAAEADWGRMVDLVFATSSSISKTKPSAPPRANRPAVMPATLERFNQASELAQMAAKAGVTSVAFRAMQRALAGGPPLNPQQNLRGRLVVYNRGMAKGVMEENQVQQVEQTLHDLEAHWLRAKAPAEQVYEALRLAVLPDARPAEIFLYARPLIWRDGYQQQGQYELLPPRSAGGLLARWAERAGKTEELRKLIETRKGQPTAELAGEILRALVAQSGTDPGSTERELEALTQRLEKDTQPKTAELACHVALPALNVERTSAAAEALITAAARNLGKQAENTVEPNLLLVLARHRFDHGDPAGGLARLREMLGTVERQVTRNAGRNAQWADQQRQWLHDKAALELVRAGRWDDVLVMLGASADANAAFGKGVYQMNQADQSLPTTLAAVGEHLAGMPSRKRYELLQAWTLPTGERKEVRLLAAFVPESPAPPAVFGKAPASVRAPELVTTADWLVTAAREAGRLDELAEQVQKAIAAKEAAQPQKPATPAKPPAPARDDNGSLLKLMIDLARGRAAEVRPHLEKRLAALRTPTDSDVNNFGRTGVRMVAWPEYLVTRAALADPAARDLGEAMARRMMEADPSRQFQWQDASFLSHLRIDLATAEVARAGTGPAAVGADPGLSLWHRDRPASGRIGGAWVELDGHLAHVPPAAGGRNLSGVPGAEPDPYALFFDLPLTGTFEVSVDAFIGTDHGAGLGYGGLVMEPSARMPNQFWNNGIPRIYPSSNMWTTGRHVLINRECRYLVHEAFNRLTVRVEPAKVRYLVNGHLFFEDVDPSATSPWILLAAGTGLAAQFRDVAIAGTPTIPREVRLVQGDRLEGWRAVYAAMSPPRRKGSGDTYNQAMFDMQSQDPEDYPWHARDGVLHGRAAGAYSWAVNGQDHLSYARPLHDGETIAYEFFYEPEAIMVHPALGPLAFLIEPAGVRLHWLSSRAAYEAGGLPPDNVADEPDNRREAVVLKAGDWNQVRFSLKGGRTLLELNGATIFERPMGQDQDRQFGFYHDAIKTAARVRNVVLTGNWPQALTAAQLARPAARLGDEPTADRRGRRSLIGERFVAMDAGRVLQRVQSSSTAERYEVLKDWVLPDESRPEFRLAGDFTPMDPAGPPPTAPSRGADASAPPLGKGGLGAVRPIRRIHTGGDLVAPTFSLVAAAQELGKLDELAASVRGAKADSERGRLALLALIATAKQDETSARQSLKDLQPLLAKLPRESPEWERWPELVAAAHAAPGPEAFALLDVLAAEPVKENEETPPQRVRKLNPRTGVPYPDEQEAGTSLWRKQARHAQAAARLRERGEPFESDPDLSFWSRVTHGNIATRGLGHPRPHWSARDGVWTHSPGHERDCLYFHVPLRGDFDLACEVSAALGREVQLVYGTIGVGLKGDGKGLRITDQGRDLPDSPLDPPLKDLKGWCSYRLSVRDGTLTVTIDGRKVHEQGLPTAPDPWLLVRSRADQEGAVRGLTISGTPSVPEILDLSGFADLTGWQSDEPEDPAAVLNDEVRAWTKRGPEILGRLATEVPGSRQESLLRYHRPMLEDGTIEYEFFYEPGKSLVHPALDRIVFLMDPAGVKIHWRTDGAYERSGLAPDNATDEPANRRGPKPLPLKAGTWNRLRIELEGDAATLTLNDVETYERQLESTNQRFFGLFHEADATEARVRNVTYRGRWPRELPAGTLGAKDP
jgi:tetratricopeptide (TPR) repeat protein